MVKLLRLVVDIYIKLNIKYPILVKSLSAAGIASCGDMGAQYIQWKDSNTCSNSSSSSSSIHNSSSSSNNNNNNNNNNNHSPSSSTTTTSSKQVLNNNVNNNKFNIDFQRNISMACFGFTYTGWFQYHWFHYLITVLFPRGKSNNNNNNNNRMMKNKPSTTTTRLTTSKYASFVKMLGNNVNQYKYVWGPVVVNQFLMVPFFYYPFFFIMTGLIRNLPMKDIWGNFEIKNIYEICMKNWLLWLPAQIIQFQFIPVQFHILYVSMIGLLWNGILSFYTMTSTSTSTSKSISFQSQTPSLLLLKEEQVQEGEKKIENKKIK